MMTFEQFFSTATGGNQAYDYQRRLAADPECQSRLIEIPTGLGKTAAVVLAWLWNRVAFPSLNSPAGPEPVERQPSTLNSPPWPRRLIYCLPMRTLVEQTEREVRTWLEKLALTEKVGVHLLMGGEERGEWDIHPEREAILIGTQDMLLSRALNRGYGMSRYRWPMHFALLNNDALWVMDETQLMGVSVETSAQLDGFRGAANGACPTWWMSATLDKARLATVDHPEPPGGWNTISLSDAERASGGVQRRFAAKKPVAKAELTLLAGNKKDYGKQVSALIREKHQAGTLTLVVVNRVARAQEIYAALLAGKPKLEPAHIALIHSRFRPVDRARHTALLFGNGDRIVIATQAVEAGVDVSARCLISELAPWSSLVQRFGRCNRAGERDDAEIVWIDVQPKDDKDDLALPYPAGELTTARTELEKLADAGSQTLAGIIVREPPVIRPVLRRRDLIDLFDTTPDLCGQDLDISRYIRDGEDSDVQFFWRDLSAKNEEGEEADGVPLDDDELCRVSVGNAGKFAKSDKVRAFIWDPLNKEWTATKRMRPGAVYLIDSASGGYSDNDGWTGDVQDKVGKCLAGFPPRESYDKDRLSFIRHWQELDQHTEEVVETIDDLAATLQLDAAASSFLHTAAQWHDVGKAHEKFQTMLCGREADRREKLWAKSALPDGKCERRGFRHELASALAWLLHGPADAPDRDLIAYLIGAHHGKVRLSIRALPDEKGAKGNGEQPFARGVWHGDELPAVALPGVPAVPLRLDLSFMQMGDGEHGPSWLARMIALRDRLGPFRLAYLETLLRAADMRASKTAAAAASQP